MAVRRRRSLQLVHSCCQGILESLARRLRAMAEEVKIVIAGQLGLVRAY